MNKYNAYHGEHELKNTLVKLAQDHAKMDHYIRGTFGKTQNNVFRGCSVGCSINDLNKIKGTSVALGNHAALARQLGVPVFIIKLQDFIFENLPVNKSTHWTERLFSAIPVGADLSTVMPKFLKFILESCFEHVQDDNFVEQKDAVEQSLSVINDWLEKGAADAAHADAAHADAARAAHADAARAAHAARAAAYAAAYAARAAAHAAHAAAHAAYADAYADAHAAYAAADATYADAAEKYTDKLIELIQECE